MAGGRKSAYDSKVKSRFNDIERWLKGGASEKQVAEALGISESTWFKYKKEINEFSQFIKSIERTELVLDLRSALIKKALGFSYEEKKQYIKTDEEGNPYTYVEIMTRQALPDVAAINLALKNYDKDNWANDPQMIKLREQELELRKLQVESNTW